MKKLAILVLCLAVGSAALPAQAARLVIQQVDTSLYPEMKVFLSVLDAGGRPLLGLKAENFQVVENGAEVAGVRCGSVFKNREWLALSLVMDRSGSMAGEFLAKARAAASDFVANLGLGDRVGLVTFDSAVSLARDIAQDKAGIQDLIHAVQAGSNTALYDAILFALDGIGKQASPRKAIIALTDGADTRSKATIDECLRAAKEQGVPVYLIGLGRSLNQEVLRRLAEASGGGYFPAPQAGDLLEIYRRISDQLENQYVLLYRSSSLNARGVGTLLVNLKLGEAAARDRRYFSLVRDVPTAGAAAATLPTAAAASASAARPVAAPMAAAGAGLLIFALGGALLGLALALLLVLVPGRLRQAGMALKTVIVVLAAALFSLAGALAYLAAHGGMQP